MLRAVSLIDYCMSHPQKLFEQESEELRLSPQFALLEPFVPKSPKQVPSEPAPGTGAVGRLDKLT